MGQGSKWVVDGVGGDENDLRADEEGFDHVLGE